MFYKIKKTAFLRLKFIYHGNRSYASLKKKKKFDPAALVFMRYIIINKLDFVNLIFKKYH